MPGIAFAGDLHLSRAIYSGQLPSMVGDSEFALAQITDYCREHSLDMVLLGDNFDKRFPDGELLSCMLRALDDLSVGFIQGQHCQQNIGWPGVEGRPSKSRIHLHPLKRCEIFGHDINVFGFDYTPRHRLEEMLKSVPDDCEILCLHQLNADVMTLEDQWTLDMTWVPEHVKATLMGDWHGLPQDGVTEGRRWLYTGSSTVRSVGEPLNKSFVVATRDQSGELVFERIPLKTRPYIYNDLVFPDDLDNWLANIEAAIGSAMASAYLPEYVASPLVVCRYNVEIPEAYDRIQDKLAARISKQNVFLHLMPNRKFVPDGPEWVDKSLPLISLQSAIDEAVDKELSPVLHEFVSDLSVSHEPKDVVVAFKTKHQVIDNPSSAIPTSGD